MVSDGPLSPAEMTMEVAQLLRDAGPWGRCSRSRCLTVISVCCNSDWWANVIWKVMVEPVGGGPLLDGIAFNVDTALAG